MTINLPNLRSKEELREFVYHAIGMIEAVDEIQQQLEILDGVFASDPERASTIMGRLRAEIYTHLPYHHKALRRPFLKLSHIISREVGDDEPGDLPPIVG